MATQSSPDRICVMGVSGAGKTLIGSRLAAALGVPFLEGDDLHAPANIRKMAQGTPLTDADRSGWLAAIAARIGDATRRGTGLIVACSALKRQYRDVLRGADPGLRFVHLAGDRALIAERLAQRPGHFMPGALLESQLATLERPAADERAWTCDVADTPDTIVAQLRARLEA